MRDDKVAAYAGTLAEFYDRYLVPLNFATVRGGRGQSCKGSSPASRSGDGGGTGVVTEALLRTLPSNVTITATDLNQQMIERGKAR